MIARRMFGTVRYGRTGAVVLVTSSPLLPNKVKTGSANSQVPAQGRGGMWQQYHLALAAW